MAAELYQLLKAEKIKPPYILVGQSLGGIIARCFAALYPKETAGMVLIDPAHEDDFIELRKVRSTVDKIAFNKEYQSYKNRPDRTPGHNAESECIFDTTGYSIDARIMKKTKWPPKIPITVLTSLQTTGATEYSDLDLKIKFDLREGWKKQAPQLKHITTTQSGHYIQIQEPELVVQEIAKMIATVRNKKKR